MIKKSFFTLITATLLLVSCETGPTGPNCGTVKFSWKQNGISYEGNSDIYWSSSYESYSLTACYDDINAPMVNLRLHLPIAVGTYNLAHIQAAQSPNTGDASYFDNSGGPYFTTDSTHLGTVVITSVNADSSITGTFEFDAIQYSSGNVVDITNGQFTAVK